MDEKNNEKHIPVAEPEFSGNEKKYLNEAIDSGWISSGGGFIEKFEKQFAEFCGCAFATSTSNGTTALHLALLALDIKDGDEVIVPNLTFVATANAVIYVGAKPVFVDCEADTWNIDPQKIEERIASKTKAIIAVHLYGHPCDMNSILDIARRRNLKVIEDCAESHGAKYNGKTVGGFGDIGCFSFFGNKIITTGEGGMCTTNNPELFAKMKLYKNHGMDPSKKYWHPVVGYNFRMTNMHAAVGVAQLEKIDSLISGRRRAADFYNRLLGDLPGIGRCVEKEYAFNVYWMYSVLLDNEKERNMLMDFLADNNVETRPLFWPMSMMPPYKKYLSQDDAFPVSEGTAVRGINLPAGPKLTLDDQSRIVGLIKKFKETK